MAPRRRKKIRTKVSTRPIRPPGLIVVSVPIDDLRSADYNPRMWDETQLEKLMESIRRYGFIDPVIANGSSRRRNILIGGHMRLEAAQRLGMTEVPVVFVDIPDIGREKDLNLRLNRSTGQWDFEKLKEFNVEMLLDVGFNATELSEIWDGALGTEDDYFNVEKELEKIKKPTVKVGELYQLGEHRLIIGDSTDPAVVSRLAGKTKVAMINTDPIFNIGLDYNRGVSLKMNYGGKANDKKSPEEYADFLRKLIRNALSVAQPDAHVLFWCDENWIWLLQTLYRELGIKPQRVCSWLKGNWSMTPQVAFNKATESCVYGTVGKPYLAPGVTNLHEVMNKEVGTGNRMIEDVIDMFTIWLSKRVHGSEMEHPTQKPPSVYEKALRRCTKPGDRVLDLCAGSGSLMVACHQMKRRALLAEIEPVFAELCIRRFEAISGQKASLLKS